MHKIIEQDGLFISKTIIGTFLFSSNNEFLKFLKITSVLRSLLSAWSRTKKWPIHTAMLSSKCSGKSLGEKSRFYYLIMLQIENNEIIYINATIKHLYQNHNATKTIVIMINYCIMGIFRGSLIFTVWWFFQFADFNFREFKAKSSLLPISNTFAAFNFRGLEANREKYPLYSI